MQNERSFPAHPDSLAAARRFVRDTLQAGRVDPATAQLLVSELATNAIVHAESPFRVRITFRDPEMRIEVINDEPELFLTICQPTGTGGWGLHLLENLAQRWGSESTRDHKVVWFDLPIADTGSMA